MEQNDSLLEFPCEFPIKVMGHVDSGFEARALEIVYRHVPGFNPGRMRSRMSRKASYLSVTFTIQAESREQLDNLYRELTSCQEVLMVL
jgi:putative lipoic acid-binding regulatory protein